MTSLAQVPAIDRGSSCTLQQVHHCGEVPRSLLARGIHRGAGSGGESDQPAPMVLPVIRNLYPSLGLKVTEASADGQRRTEVTAGCDVTDADLIALCDPPCDVGENAPVLPREVPKRVACPCSRFHGL